MQLALEMAGIGSRFLAIALDTLIEAGVMFVLFITLALIGGTLVSFSSDLGPWFVGGLIFVFFLLNYGYFAIFEVIWNGQTPGKRMIGIRVIKDTGRPLTPGETIARNLMRIVDSLPTLYGVGVVTAALNSQNRRLGDMLVGAIVVREASLQDWKPSWEAPASTPAMSAVQGQTISLEDLRLIDTFLARRHTLELAVRQRTAEQILRRLNIEIPADRSLTGPTESILEALSYQKRSSGHGS
jgi:uncharacterized RDD family membrane protein YckC